eukprot:TRINITY_DN55040_c0_g1_i1.p1 TRINITY_DN55040_c0_g1~~TRINITY_DN55040_c0_g1_i1.p1  ORF type:complete len:557 (-),score=94.37 TRINITY_DN55040_c0_g1_i1:248-1918(-)
MPCGCAAPSKVSLLTVFVALVGLTQPAFGGLFLAKLTETELKRVLLTEIESAIGSNLHDVTKGRIEEMQTALKPTFDILAKGDRLDHDGVRYLLNRFFFQQHGWMINGLQDTGNAPKRSPKLIMRHHIPEVVQDMFEHRVGNEGGATLKDVVSLAAVIEHLIRDELEGRQETLYEALGYKRTDNLAYDNTLTIMELYMINFLRNDDASMWSDEQIRMLEMRFHLQYRAWPKLKLVVREVLAGAAMSGQTSFSFAEVTKLLEVMADRFAPFYGTQCQTLRSGLLSLEDGKSGRVRLADFYSAGVETIPELREPVDVLRSIGVLDEVDPANIRVIIANYVSGFSNCIARTSFYSTCCADSCGPILDKIEAKLGKAEASRDEIKSAIEETTVLTPWLQQRLEDLARHHGDRIPLHGRLFAQWLHFIHPRDCMYPHVAGSTITIGEIDDVMRKSLPLSLQELRNMSSYLNQISQQGAESRGEHVDASHGSGMWTMDEELFAEPSLEELYARSHPSPANKILWWIFAAASLLIAAGLLRVRWMTKKTQNWGPEGVFEAKSV